MRQNMFDYERRARRSPQELGAQFTIDPTITPMMDGDRKVLALNMPRRGSPGLPRSASPSATCRTSSGARSDRRLDPRRPALQRGPHRLLRLALRRRLSVRAVPAALRERAQQRFIDIWRDSPQFHEVRSIRRGDLTTCSSCSAPRHLHALPRPGLHGGRHARAVDPGLREVLRADGHSHGEHARAPGGGDAHALLSGPRREAALSGDSRARVLEEPRFEEARSRSLSGVARSLAVEVVDCLPQHA